MVIKVDNLVKRYGDLIALDHFGLEVKEFIRLVLKGKSEPRARFFAFGTGRQSTCEVRG